MRMLRLVVLAALVALLGCTTSVPEPAPSDAAAPAAGRIIMASVPAVPAVKLSPEIDLRLRGRRQTIGRALAKSPAKGAASDARVDACTSKALMWADLKVCLDAIAAPVIDAGTFKLAALRGPVPSSKTSWLVPHWFTNLSTGSNDNTCVTSGSPCHDADEIIARWGTTNPILLQATDVTQQANDTTTLLRWDPIIGPGGTFTFLPATTTVLSGTLGTTTAKDRTRGAAGAYSCPSATLCPFLQSTWTSISAATQVGRLIVNTTHAGTAWIDGISGTTAILSQPYQNNVPGFVTFPNEVDTWTTGDSFTILQPVKYHLASFNPTIAVGDSADDSYFAFIGGGWLDDPSGTPDTTTSDISRLVRITQGRVDTYYHPSSYQIGFDGTFENDFFAGGGVFTDVDVQGGSFGALTNINASIFSGILDGDVILHNVVFVGAVTANVVNIWGYVGFANVTGSGGIQLNGDVGLTGDAYGGNGQLYGKYELDQFINNKSFGYFDTSANSFLGTSTLECRQAAFASTVDRTINPEQWYGPRPLSAAQLGTSIASGGFGDFAQCSSGATYRNLTEPSSAPSDLCSAAGSFMTGKVATPCGTPAGTGCATCTTITAGTAIGVSGGPSYTISNNGVTSLTAGSNISLSGSTGAITVSASAGAVSSVSGSSGVSCSPTTGAVSCTNTGVTSNVAGTAISVSSATGASTISLTPCSVNGQLLQTISGAQSCETLSQDLAWDSPVPGAFTVVGIQATPVPVPSGSDVGLHWNHSAGALSWNTEDVAGGGTGQTSLTSNAFLLGSGTSPVSFLTPAVADTVVGTTNGTTWSSFLPLPITSFAGGGAVNLTSAATYFSLASFSDTSTPTRTYSFIGNLSCSNAAAVRIKYGISVNSTSANTVELTMDIQGGTTEFNTGGINFAVATSGSNTFRFLAQDTTTVSSTCNGYLTMIKTVQ